MLERSSLVMIGAGVYGREVLSWIEDLPPNERNFDFKGFIDDDASTADREGSRYLGGIRSYQPSPEDVFICSIAATKPRLEICQSFIDKGSSFITFIHPTARIDRNCSVGVGSVVAPFGYVAIGANVGRFVLMNVHASVGHDATVGDACTMNSYTDITGQVVLENGVYMGSHASILQSVRVGAFAKIGAGSLVMRNVKPGITVFGIPAKSISAD